MYSIIISLFEVSHISKRVITRNDYTVMAFENKFCRYYALRSFHLSILSQKNPSQCYIRLRSYLR